MSNAGSMSDVLEWAPIQQNGFKNFGGAIAEKSVPLRVCAWLLWLRRYSMCQLFAQILSWSLRSNMSSKHLSGNCMVVANFIRFHIISFKFSFFFRVIPIISWLPLQYCPCLTAFRIFYIYPYVPLHRFRYETFQTLSPRHVSSANSLTLSLDEHGTDKKFRILN